MSALAKRIAPLVERYRGRSLRERALIAATLAAATWMLWAATLDGLLERSEARVSGALNSTEQRIAGALAEHSRLQAALAGNPDERLLRERERLDAELQKMNASLGNLLRRFVDPERMPALLEDVIRRHEGLTLRRIESLPAEPLNVAETPPGAEPVEPLWIYRHPLRLEFEGAYFEVLAYLDELERGPWQFGWRELRYEVHEHPIARVTLEIETLSREKNWIGV